MTPEERKLAAEVMASDGPWEQRMPGATEWRDVMHPVFNWQLSEYRVKPKPIVRYLNVYPMSFSADRYVTRCEADERAGQSRIACIRVEYTEGQYDE